MGSKLLTFLKGSYLFFCGFIFFYGITSCTQKSNAQKIEAVEVLDKSPFMGETFYKVYYLDDYVVYESHYLYQMSIRRLQVDTMNRSIDSKDSVLTPKWRTQFFVLRKDSSYGYRYDPSGEHPTRRLPAVYEINKITGTNSFDSFLRLKPDTINWNTDKTELKEVYVFPKKQHSPTGRIIFYYSKKLNSLRLSFNNIMDKVKGMKFFKVETYVDEFYSEKEKRIWPSTIDATEMKETVAENLEEILNYCNEYKRSISKK